MMVSDGALSRSSIELQGCGVRDEREVLIRVQEVTVVDERGGRNENIRHRDDAPALSELKPQPFGAPQDGLGERQVVQPAQRVVQLRILGVIPRAGQDFDADDGIDGGAIALE